MEPLGLHEESQGELGVMAEIGSDPSRKFDDGGYDRGGLTRCVWNVLVNSRFAPSPGLLSDRHFTYYHRCNDVSNDGYGTTVVFQQSLRGAVVASGVWP